MAHIRVALVYKEGQDPQDIIENNCRDNYYGVPIEPFNYDYLTIESEPVKVSELDWNFNKIGSIINNEEEVYSISWITSLTKEEYEEVVKTLNKDDLVVICDGHL